MDKYEFKLKIDEMKALVSARNYNAAAEIAETISWRKIRNLNALVLAGEVFEQVGRYEDSKEILLMAYDKSPIGRNIIYRLAEIAIKTQKFDEAQEYYDEFVDIAPHDNLKYVLKYKMTAAQGLPYKEQIRILEELKEQEYSEEWAYELAYLYYKDMQPEKCVEACDELILWFGDGIYVEKALELKLHFQPLSKPQEEKYRMFRQKRTGVIEVKPNDFPESGVDGNEAVEIPSVKPYTGQYTANLQEEIAKGMQQISAVKMRNPGMGQKAVNPAGTNQGLRGFRLRYPKQQKAQSQPVQAYREPQEDPVQAYQQGMQEDPARAYQQGMQGDLVHAYQEPQGWQVQGAQGQSVQAYQQGDPVRAYQEPQGTQGDPVHAYQPQQEPQMQYSVPREPARELTIEEIQEEWERTKQAMQEALQEARKAEEQEQETKKERSLEEAEQLMQRLLSIIPQLAGGMASQESAEQGIGSEDGQPAQVQNDLEQAGRIVEGMNQILQEQIDSILAQEEQQQKQAFDVHNVSDPTRELPHLPEELTKGNEDGAAEKIEMDGSSLEKDTFEDNPVMNAYKEAVQPGISAIDLLRRVRMGKTDVNSMQQSEAENTAGTMPQQHAETPAMDAVQQTQPEMPVMDAVQQMQPEIPAMDAVQQMQPEIPAMDAVQQTQLEMPVKHVAQQLHAGMPAAGSMQQPEISVTGYQEQNLAAAAGPNVSADSGNGNNIQSEDMGMEAGRQVWDMNMESEDSRMISGYPVKNTGMQSENIQESINMQSGYQPEHMDLNDRQGDFTEYQDGRQMGEPEYSDGRQMGEPEYSDGRQMFQPGYSDSRQGYSSGNMAGSGKYVSANRDSSQENQLENDMETRQEYPLENKEMNAETEYGNEQDNLFFAARPRFLTQAQLQAGSGMDVKKETQVTKEFSKEAMAASRTAGFYENAAQADGQNMDEMKRLTQEQKQIFSYFVPIAGMEAQIYDLISGVSEHLQYDKHALSGNIIIEGISGSGKTVLIMDIIKALQKEIRLPAGKTGKIDANALNQKDLDVLFEKISGGCLIIESAGRISRETAVKLSRCMENDHAGTLYILEDTAEGIQKALERDSSFAAKFTQKISIPLFSLDELVEFGKAYANDLNYDIDEMGVLALYKRIGHIQKLDHVTTLTEVKEIVDEAIDNAEKGVLKKVFGILTATRANDDNYVILREKDFEE